MNEKIKEQMKPAAKFYIINNTAMVRKAGFLNPDKRVDDELIIMEQRVLAPIPDTVEVIQPIMTGQVEASNDF